VSNSFIQSLVADHKAVRRLNKRDPLILMGALFLGAIAIVAATLGLRDDVVDGHPAEIVLLRGGVLLALGLSSLIAVIAFSRPSVGRHSDGWIWALGVAALFPAITLLAAVTGQFPAWVLTAPSGPVCLIVSLALAIVMGAALTFWARRGAPTRPVLQAWLIGLSSGAFATFSYSLHCDSSTISYAGIWYTGAIVLASCSGRLLLPRLLRW